MTPPFEPTPLENADRGLDPSLTEPVDPTAVSGTDAAFLAQALEVARSSRQNGNHPFGAILVTRDGGILDAENSVVTGNDPTGHAELNLVRRAGAQLSAAELTASTLYTSAEPCIMCSGAIHWAGIGRVVYALPEESLGALVPSQDGAPTLNLPCREVFARSGAAVIVAGPALVAEAAAVHDGFWDGRG